MVSCLLLSWIIILDSFQTHFSERCHLLRVMFKIKHVFNDKKNLYGTIESCHFEDRFQVLNVLIFHQVMFVLTCIFQHNDLCISVHLYSDQVHGTLWEYIYHDMPVWFYIYTYNMSIKGYLYVFNLAFETFPWTLQFVVQPQSSVEDLHNSERSYHSNS